MTLLNILQKADLSFFSSKKLKAITNGTFLLQQLEYSQKPFGNACCICKKIYFFNHVLCSKWGQVMFNVASQFTAQPKINSHFQIFRYIWPRHILSATFFDLFLHWVSVVYYYYRLSKYNQMALFPAKSGQLMIKSTGFQYPSLSLSTDQSNFWL